jgi:hypothetical protein
MTTILTAHQPLYLPWLGFFHKVAMSDIFVFMDDVQFINDDYIHRNKIKMPTGWIWLTVPILSKEHLNKKIKDMQIDNDKNWNKKHWKSISSNYAKAPYFESYKDFFENIYEKKWDNLADLDECLLKYLLKELKISVKLIKASEQNFEGKKSDRILDMCMKLGADAYIFGELGKNYADVEDFENKGVKVYFQKYVHPVYSQLHGDFVSHLSIIDLLFCYGEKSYDILMRENPTRDDLINILNLK